ncbi:MAG: FimV/HubP family polar landmark protein, partial [Arenimonas sp.]
EVNSLSADEAAALVSQQAAAWRSPRQPVPQPEESSADQNIAVTPAAPKPASPPRATAARPSRPSSRLEIVPPSGNAAARGAQSGAAAGAGGTELRAELAQAREDLAARTAEVTELKSRVSDLEKTEADRQRLIEMQNSQLKELQDRLKQMESEPAVAAAPDTAAPAPAPAPAATADATAADTAVPVAAPAEAPQAKPWYSNLYILGGALLLVLGGLVLALRRAKPKPENGEAAPRRLSDDEALRASIAKTREAGEKIKPQPTPAVVAPAAAKPALPADPALHALEEAVRERPQDLEAHLSLLRLHHSRGNAKQYELAAQAMRARVPSTMDPRWREAVIMGASLMPGDTLFSQAGWNSPRFGDTEAPARAAPAAPMPPPAATPAPVPTPVAAVVAPAVAAVAPAAAVVAPAAPAKPTPAPAPVVASASVTATPQPAERAPAPVKVFDLPSEAETGSEIDLDDHSAAFGDFGASPTDVHRSEAQMMVEDEASATRIELAKAYLAIGDLDGARSMLEEVLAEGGPVAQSEAGRILKEIG